MSGFAGQELLTTEEAEVNGGNLNLFKIWITRKTVDLFFTQDLRSKPISKAYHYRGSL